MRGTVKYRPTRHQGEQIKNRMASPHKANEERRSKSCNQEQHTHREHHQYRRSKSGNHNTNW